MAQKPNTFGSPPPAPGSPSIDLLSSVNDGSQPETPPQRNEGGLPPVEGDAPPPETPAPPAAGAQPESSLPETPSDAATGDSLPGTSSNPDADKAPLRELDRSRAFGEIIGAANGARYLQDGVYFGGNEMELEGQ